MTSCSTAARRAATWQREYWNVVAKDSARRNAAINQLKRSTAAAPQYAAAVDARPSCCSRPGAVMKALRCCRRWPIQQWLQQRASDMWYAQIKDQPASNASVSALQVLSVFSDGENVTAARSQLEAQQKTARRSKLSVRKRRPGGSECPDRVIRRWRNCKAVSAKPCRQRSHWRAGRTYSQKGDRARAVAQFEKGDRLRSAER